MAAGDLTPARRVDSFDELTQAGDYFLGSVRSSDDEPPYKQLWFLLPTHKGADLFDHVDEHSGLHGIGERMHDGSQGWIITENADGSVSSQPSIGCGPPPYYWHGYLEPGNVWHEV